MMTVKCYVEVETLWRARSRPLLKEESENENVNASGDMFAEAIRQVAA